jgi:hypothetical protein
MKTTLSIAALMASAVVALSADPVPDLTGQGADSFKAHLGKEVALRGRLEQGKQGPCLFGATPTNVVFYVIPNMPTNGSYIYPTSWERLMHQQVRVTGELRFRSFDRPKKDSLVQIPSDYYYMVLQRTSIERLDSQ